MPINVTRQDFFTKMPRTTPHESFRHVPPAEPGSKPAMPDTLDAPEAAQVTLWLQNRVDTAVVLADSITKMNAFKTYFASPAYAAWKIANYLARESQWHWARVDAAILNYPAVAPSTIETGVGADPPPAILPKQEP